MIGHFSGKLTAEKADEILRRRIDLARVAQSAAKIELSEVIDDPRLSFKVAKSVVLGSLSTGRRVAAGINKQNPGSKLRVPTEAELLNLNEVLGDKLGGTGYWIWTETEHADYPGQFVLRRLAGVDRRYGVPEGVYCNYAVRLVEDK